MMVASFGDKYYSMNHQDIKESLETVIIEQHIPTVLGLRRLQMMGNFALMVSLLRGDVAEAGVYTGGLLAFLARMLPEKMVYGFDSWEGLPEPTPEDERALVKASGVVEKGRLKVDMPIRIPKLYPNVTLYKGWFKDTLNKVADRTFCLVHVDCDFYSGAKQCIDFFYPRMVDGGFMIFDDYCSVHKGIIKAVDEFFGDRDGFEWWVTEPDIPCRNFIVRIGRN